MNEKSTAIIKATWGMGWDGKVVGSKISGRWQFEVANTEDELSGLLLDGENRFMSDFICGAKLHLHDDLMTESGFPKTPGVLGALGSVLRRFRTELEK